MFTNKNLTAQQRLSKAVVAIMGNPRYVALAGVLMIGDKSVEPDALKCQTAHTDGKNEVYGEAFVNKLNDAELRFLVLHECYHKLYRHLTTWQHLWEEDANRANQACDYVINIKLVDDNADGFATMTGELEKGVINEKYRGWDSAQVFHDLKQNDKGEGSGPSGGSGEGFDQHGWEDAESMTAEEKKDLAREVNEAVRQGALLAGKSGSGGMRDLAELLEPQVDWRDVLREFITTTCQGSDYSTWNRPNRRYIGAGVYMPSGISEQIGEIVVAVDTSGSIGSRELATFLSEVKSVADTMNPDGIRLLYWDTEVCGDEHYAMSETSNIVQSTKPAGGGGTDVNCVPEYIRDEGIKAQAVIVLTDGHLYGGWGQWSQPVLWCVLDNPDAKPSLGTVVHVKSENM